MLISKGSTFSSAGIAGIKVGFDFLTSDFNDYYFNEIEDCAGSKSLCILKSVDTSEMIMQHISVSV